MAGTRIFISYRHDDTATEVARLMTCLKKSQKYIFRDKSKIQVAERFPRKLEEALNEAGIVLVVIGKHWFSASDSQGLRRLDDPDDFVRREIAHAVQRAETDCFLDIIPVLMSGAKMPRAKDLPSDLQPLAELNAMEIRSKNFEQSVDALSKRINELYAEHADRAAGELDDVDEYLSGKDMDLSEAVSISPTYARDPDLHDLPHAAEWECTWCNSLFKASFETFDGPYFEGQLIQPANFEFEGTWAYRPGPDKTLAMVLSGKTMAGDDYIVTIPIQEKVGRQSYGGRSANGDYFRLECVRRKQESHRSF